MSEPFLTFLLWGLHFLVYLSVHNQSSATEFVEASVYLGVSAEAYIAKCKCQRPWHFLTCNPIMSDKQQKMYADIFFKMKVTLYFRQGLNPGNKFKAKPSNLGSFNCAAKILDTGLLSELPRLEWKILLHILYFELLHNWTALRNSNICIRMRGSRDRKERTLSSIP